MGSAVCRVFILFPLILQIVAFLHLSLCVQNLRPLQVCPLSILTSKSDDSLIKSNDEH